MISISENYLNKIMGLWFTPLTAIKTLKEEKNISPSFFFLFISAMLTSFVSMVFHILQKAPIRIAFSAAKNALLYHILAVFVFSGIFHLIIMLSGGNSKYYQTFKAFAYMSAFGIIYALIIGLAGFIVWIDILNILLIIWTLILLSTTLKYYTELTTAKLVLIWLVYLVILIGIMWTFAKLISIYLPIHP